MRTFVPLFALLMLVAGSVLVAGCSEDALTAPGDEVIEVTDDVAFAKPNDKGKPPKDDGGSAVPILANVTGSMYSTNFAGAEKDLGGGALSIESDGFNAPTVNDFLGLDVTSDCYLYKEPRKGDLPDGSVANSFFNMSGTQNARYFIEVGNTNGADPMNSITQWFEYGTDIVEVSIKSHPYVDSDPVVEDDGTTLRYSGGTLQFRNRDGGPRFTYAWTCDNTDLGFTVSVMR